MKGVKTMDDASGIKGAITRYKLLEVEFKQGQAGHRELAHAALAVANAYYERCLGHPYRRASRKAGDEWYREARYHEAKAGVSVTDKVLLPDVMRSERNNRVMGFAVKTALVVVVALLLAIVYL